MIIGGTHSPKRAMRFFYICIFSKKPNFKLAICGLFLYLGISF